MSLSDPPRATSADAAYGVAAAGVSAVPVVGGAAVELVTAVFGPPLQRRQQDWFEELADAVRFLQERQVPLDSPAFVSAVAMASRIALGTHLAEKIGMLKAAIIHSALPDRSSDFLTTRFLRLIEELDPEHFALLAFMRDPAGHFDRRSIPRPSVSMGGLGSVFEHARIPIRDIDVVLRDVTDRGLADGGAWRTLMTSAGLWASRTTLTGNQLLDFVTIVDLEEV